MQDIARRLCCGLLSCISLCACNPPQRAQPSAADAPSPRLRALPTYAFEPPAAWRSRKPSEPPVEPPDLARETWRVLVSQDNPIQTKTPTWQPVRAQETVELAMPPGSSFRCIVPPLRVSSEANTFGTRFKAWLFTRSFLCSSDQFQTWTETTLQVRQAADGTRTLGPTAGSLLRDRAHGEPTLHTFVLMRSEPYERSATFGPPQVLKEPLEGMDLD